MENEFSPKIIDDFVGNKEVVEEFKKWITEVKQNASYPKRICFITGTNGTGKSLLVNLVLKKEGYTIREFLSSNLRIKQERDFLYQALCFRDILGFSKTFNKAIVIDDFENMCLASHEVFKKVKEFIKSKKSIGIPVIFIGNKYFKGKRPLMGTSVYFRLNPRTLNDIHNILKYILNVIFKNKNILFLQNKEEQLDICRKAGGDVRKIIKYFELINPSLNENKIDMIENSRKGPLYSLERIINYNNNINIKSILNEIVCESSIPYGIYVSYINYIPWVIKKNKIYCQKYSELLKYVSELFSIYGTIKDYESSHQMWELNDIANIIACWGMRVLIKENLNNKGSVNKLSYTPKNLWWVDLEKNKKSGDEPIDIGIFSKILRSSINNSILLNNSFKLLEIGVGNTLSCRPKNIRSTLQILQLLKLKNGNKNDNLDKILKSVRVNY